MVLSGRDKIARKSVQTLVVSVCASALIACGGGGGGSSSLGISSSCNTAASDQFNCQALVNSLANNVMLPAVEAFVDSSQALKNDVDDYCAALATVELDDDAPALDAARAGWRSAMTDWQEIEMMQVGPLLDNSGALRANIYSWPAVDSCRVDQDVVLAEEAGYSIASRTPDRKGLAALEYVLFSDSLDHTCPSNITVVATWNDRSEADRGIARCDYAAITAADVLRLSQELETAWSAEAGFIDQVASPASSSRFSSEQEVINAFSDAIFYLEKQTNDIKLAFPAGILSGNSCGGEVCPEDVESPFSMTSKENIRNNLLAFRKLYLGEASGQPDEQGFYDFFVALNAQVEADQLVLDTDAAIAAVDAIPGSLKDAVQDPAALEKVIQAFDRTKEVTRKLKSQFVSVLGLSLPDAAAGDND